MADKKNPKGIFGWWFSKREELRFLEYTIIGLLSFGFDLLLMWLFITLFGVHYIIGAAVAFIFATIFNYSLNRVWSFRETRTEPIKSYFKFFILASINLGIIAGLLYILVEFFKISPLISRVIAGIVLFVSNFILNSIFIFRIFPHKKNKIK
jgi:putative flippase GtrA